MSATQPVDTNKTRLWVYLPSLLGTHMHTYTTVILNITKKTTIMTRKYGLDGRWGKDDKADTYKLEASISFRSFSQKRTQSHLLEKKEGEY